MGNTIIKDSIQKLKEKVRKKIGTDRMTAFKILVSRMYCATQKTDERLISLKDKHKGEKCFIVATGPSLTVDDLEKLKGKTCFSLNSIVKLFAKTEWRPDYYIVNDPDVYDSLGEEINKADLKTVLYNCFDILNFARDGIKYKSSSEYLIRVRSRNPKKHPEHILFSTDANEGFYAWHTTLGTIFQLAAYMGFSEIYLIGSDCNYKGAQRHAEGIDYKCDAAPNSGDLIIHDYELAVPVFQELGIKVFNATRGGALEVFPRVDLDKAIESKQV